MTIAGSINKQKDFNNRFFSLGGKIHRKWYFFNCLILFAITLVIFFICALLSNWIMYIICLPYFLILYILHWNNCYKRINAIIDNHRISLLLTVVWAMLSIFFGIINNKISNETAFAINSFITTIWLFLLFTPSKKESTKPSPYSCMLNVIDEYADKYNCLPFSELSEKLKQNLSKTIKPIEENSLYYNRDKSMNLVAIEQSVVQFLLQYIDAKLTSGQFHIYRGVLNDEGKSLLKIYKRLLTELIRLEVRDEDTKEIINTDWVDKNYKSLCEDIKTVG